MLVHEHDGRRLRLVVAHVYVGIVDVQRAARERRAELSGEARGCLVHDGRLLRLVVAHAHEGVVDAQRAGRERRAQLSGEGGRW